MHQLRPKIQLFVCLALVGIIWSWPISAIAESTINLRSNYPDHANELVASTTGANIQLSKQAQEAAALLGIESQVQRFIELKRSGKLEVLDKEALKLELSIIRRLMTVGLQLRTVSAQLDSEITNERHALEKLSNNRDLAVALTNNANFLQLGILSIIIDGPMEETRNAHRIYAGNVMNIVSGLTVGGLAGLAFLEQRGGIRHSKPEPNLLGQTLGLNAPIDEQLPPLLWTYLNSVSPTSENGLTRREQLLKYWRTSRAISINIDKESTKEKVSVLGPRHHQWCETIKLIDSRIIMLFDLRAMVDFLNRGLVELLEAID